MIHKYGWHGYLQVTWEIRAELSFFADIMFHCNGQVFHASQEKISISAIIPDPVAKTQFVGLWQCYGSACSFTLFFALQYFSLFKLKVILNRLPLFSIPFFLSKVSLPGCRCSHSRSFIPANILPSSMRSDISSSYHLDLIPPSFLYIKHHFPLNKQFSIDSFLNWEGLLWDFNSTIMSPPVSVPYRINSDAEATKAPMLMKDQQLYQTPAIVSIVTADYPD